MTFDPAPVRVFIACLLVGELDQATVGVVRPCNKGKSVYGAGVNERTSSITPTFYCLGADRRRPGSVRLPPGCDSGGGCSLGPAAAGGDQGVTGWAFVATSLLALALRRRRRAARRLY